MERTPIHVAADWDNAETGLWCDRCLLPSGISLPLTLTTFLPDGLYQGREHARYCDDCGARL